RIEQIVFNLLGNALKYTAESGTISVSVSPADLRNAPAFALRIEDDGVGLAEADLASIFDLFYQVDQSLARSAGGLGIGLTMVKRLVELHDGALTVASAGLGKGSVFTVTLPASQQTRARPVSSQGAASSVAGAAYSVLIVDDNVDSRELQSMALEKLGHAVKGANDGVEGIALALEDDFDVALVDIGLPIVDGYEVARRIRAEKKEHRPALIAVTGYGRDSDRERALQAGFDAHLVKPVKQAALLATIDHAVRKRRGAQSRSGT
ncbi:MAG TPA: ATP-binding protein, partial [Polyangiaceae bacterium]